MKKKIIITSIAVICILVIVIAGIFTFPSVFMKKITLNKSSDFITSHMTIDIDNIEKGRSQGII